MSKANNPPSEGWEARWFRLIDRFVPDDPQFQQVDSRRKARFVVGFSFVVAGVMGAGVLFSTAIVFLASVGKELAIPLPVNAARGCVALLMAANPFLFRKTGRLGLSGGLLIGLMLLLIGSFSWISGGINSITFLPLVIPPIFAAFLFGARWGWALALLVACHGLVLTVALHQGWLPTPLSFTKSPMVHAFLPFVALSAMMFAVSLFERGLLRAQEELIQSHEEKLDLALSRDVALQASEAKSAFMANMSHELRTPLNAIIGYAELLAEDAEFEGLERYQQDLLRIKRSGFHLLSLINDILDLAKIESGKMELRPEPVVLGAFLRELRVQVEPLMEKNRNLLEIVEPVELESFVVDPLRLKQILLNLLSNAAKFTEDGKVELEFQKIPGKDDRSWVQIEVRDTGIGMGEELQAKVFDKFTQADPSSTRKYGGTGLGLAITRECCALMGGSISVRSAPDRGSTFCVMLPLVPRKEALEETPSQILQWSQPAPLRVADGKPVALVIDDDQTVLDLLTRLLDEEGFQVVATSMSAEALGIARQIRPSLITLDVMMPELDGWSLLPMLKQDPALADIPVVMVTIVDERERGFALGASEFIAKPFSREQLRKILRKYKKDKPEGRILVVEDDEDTRRLTAEMLGKEGWSLKLAAHGREALEQLQAARPDVILLDLMMPEMDGFQFLEALRTHPRDELRRLPVVVFTAKELSPEEKQVLASQSQRICLKARQVKDSSAFQELREAIRTILAGEAT